MLPPGETHSSSGFPEERHLCYWIGIEIPRQPRGFLGLHLENAQIMFAALRSLKSRHFPAPPQLREPLDTIFRLLLGRPDAIFKDLRWGAGAEICAVQIQANIMLALIQIVACSRRKNLLPTPSVWLAKVMAFVESRLTEHVSVKEVTAYMHISRQELGRRFMIEMQCTPHDYILRRKIDLARERLSCPQPLTVTAVAHELGFSSSQHFATVFKSYAGVTPVNFRRSVQGGL